jgi:site-specific DNA-methyltransferase (adenine-specific)
MIDTYTHRQECDMYKRKEVIGDITLYLGDCLEVMLMLDKVDAVVTDPPYGIDIAGGKAIKHKGKNYAQHQLGAREGKVYKSSSWDESTPETSLFNLIKEISKNQIIWGYNYFASKVGDSKGVLVWDKKKQNDWNSTFSDCEIASISNLNSIRCIRHLWCGALRESEKETKDKQHPTQKPVAVMEWCILQLPKDTQTILDPFMGSGTTLVACAKMGRKGIGIELDEDYFNIACERVRKAYAEPDMFVEAEKKTTEQRGFDL